MKAALKRHTFSTLTTVFGDSNGLVTLPTLSGPARGMKFQLDLKQFIEPLYLFGTYEKKEVELVSKICRFDWVVWDCGIYLGYYTALFAKLCKKVIAFEPDPRNIKRTQHNLALNKFTNVEIVQAAIGAPNREVDLILTNDTNSHVDGAFIGSDREDYSTREQNEGTLRVRSISLDEALDEFPAPNLIKVDIEGAESEALKYVSRLCSEVRPILIIEMHNPDCDRAAWEFSQRENYKLTSVDTGKVFTRVQDVYGCLLCTPL